MALKVFMGVQAYEIIYESIQECLNRIITIVIRLIIVMILRISQLKSKAAHFMHAMIFVEQTEVNKAFLVMLGHIIL